MNLLETERRKAREKKARLITKRCKAGIATRREYVIELHRILNLNHKQTLNITKAFGL